MNKEREREREREKESIKAAMCIIFRHTPKLLIYVKVNTSCIFQNVWPVIITPLVLLAFSETIRKQYTHTLTCVVCTHRYAHVYKKTLLSTYGTYVRMYLSLSLSLSLLLSLCLSLSLSLALSLSSLSLSLSLLSLFSLSLSLSPSLSLSLFLSLFSLPSLPFLFHHS